MFVDGGFTTPKFTKAGLVEWLRRQPADGTYEYKDPENCLNAQFHQACGKNYMDTILDTIKPWKWFTSLTAKTEWLIAAPKPHTFGAALERAQKRGWG